VEGREGSEGQSHKEETREGGSGTTEWAKGAFDWKYREGGLYLDVCRMQIRQKMKRTHKKLLYDHSCKRILKSLKAENVNCTNNQCISQA